MRAFTVAVIAAAFLNAVDGQMLLVSSAFNNFERIPDLYCCDNIIRDTFRPSIPLQWMRPPATAQSFVLIMDEEESGMVHWIVKDIPRDATNLVSDASEVAMPPGSVELSNSFGTDAYTAPCPDTAADKHYRFRLFAMPKLHTTIVLPTNTSSMRSPDYDSQIMGDAVYVSVLVGNFSFTPAQLAMAYGYRKIEQQAEAVAEAERPYPVYGPRYRPWNATSPGKGASTNSTLKGLISNFLRQNFSGGFPTPGDDLQGVLDVPIIHVPVRFDHDNCIGLLSHQLTPSASPAPVPQTLTNRTRPAPSPRPVPILRQVKPSQAFTRGHQQPDPCSGAAAPSLAECIAVQTDASSDWACGTRSPTGSRFDLEGNSERCSLRLKFLDLKCEKQVFPRQYVCGENSSTPAESPALAWTGVPAGTKSFVITLEDASTSPKFKFDHGKMFWVVANIPATVDRIEGGASSVAMPSLSVELKNSFHFAGYTPPCPGAKDERIYRARIYALPHATTTLFLPNNPLTDHVQKQLHRLSLCTAGTVVPFSYANELRTTDTHIRPTVIFSNDSEAGELHIENE